MIDELDKKILNALNKNIRMSFRQVAKKIGISPSTLHNRVKSLENSGVLKGYIPLIDIESVGYNTMAIIAVIYGLALWKPKHPTANLPA